MQRPIIYLHDLRIGKIALWCHLIWYAVMVLFYFEAKASLWLNALGISIVIGAGLVFSVLPKGGIGAMEKWAIARLFIMPFAVSSFAALIKGQGFIVIFSPTWRENLTAAGACTFFVSIVYACKRLGLR